MGTADANQCLGKFGVGCNVSASPYAPAMSHHSDLGDTPGVEGGKSIGHLGPKNLSKGGHMTEL